MRAQSLLLYCCHSLLVLLKINISSCFLFLMERFLKGGFLVLVLCSLGFGNFWRLFFCFRILGLF